eukprot:scaffold30765_cov66-Phaeocystis_antarctica.AAC.1
MSVGIAPHRTACTPCAHSHGAPRRCVSAAPHPEPYRTGSALASHVCAARGGGAARRCHTRTSSSWCGTWAVRIGSASCGATTTRTHRCIS